MEATPLDPTDREILALLRQDARRTLSDIAGRVTLSVAAVKRRIDRMQRDGVITGFTVRVDYAKLGWGIEAFTELRFLGSANVDDIKATAMRQPETQAVFTIAGDPDALVWLRARDMRHLQEVIDEMRRSRRVTSSKTLIVLESWTVDRAFPAGGLPAGGLPAALAARSSSRPASRPAVWEAASESMRTSTTMGERPAVARGEPGILPGVRHPMVAAHRGVATGAAENTIEAFTNAISVGADMVEFDVRRTRDGELIAYHDADVNGMPVGSLTRDDIAAATGVRPPLLTEVLRACAGRIRLDVELKEDGYVPDVMAALRAGADAGQMVVTSFLPTVIAAAKAAFPEVKTGLLVGTDAPPWRLRQHYRQLFPVRLARRVRADYLAPHFRLARFGVVHRAAAAGLPCLLWTVNGDADIRRFAADSRVAAIITDEAAKALAIVAQAGAGAR